MNVTSLIETVITDGFFALDLIQINNIFNLRKTLLYLIILISYSVCEIKETEISILTI